MIIGIDIDDTITDTYEVMMSYAAEYTAEVLKKEPILNEKTNWILLNIMDKQYDEYCLYEYTRKTHFFKLGYALSKTLLI